jgi:hypothetical protein
LSGYGDHVLGKELSVLDRNGSFAEMTAPSQTTAGCRRRKRRARRCGEAIRPRYAGDLVQRVYPVRADPDGRPRRALRERWSPGSDPRDRSAPDARAAT